MLKAELAAGLALWLVGAPVVRLVERLTQAEITQPPTASPPPRHASL